ncbi:sulfite reduction-associated complex DsrMKJOP protein DsrM [Desulfocucumis palustris]|uniref:Sulfite reduction-associated complex DsrMKJOP protein DsrM n=1 Tax=Desulfocucumis palustris TaxID=1898651 RepID=A0A2L2XH45_9FIRM|nr:respiratory nitrate reductase subunit gamma [Desulfocucumis palustris]GBF35689.1 sulfite reduction-associated complex DsrMKJOP protein DsrM [Desulfocucumis palustris]
MSYFILQILPYVTGAVFTIGILYRLGRWARARIVHNITLSPFPKTNTEVATVFGTEVIFFRSLFKSDFALWIGAWFMHIALFSIIGGHVMGIYFLGKQFVYIGMSEGLSEFMSNLLGTTFGIIMFIALLYLLYRRFAIQKVREVTVTSDYLHLILLISIVAVGNIMRLIPDWGIHYEPVKEYVTYLVTLQPVPAEAEVLHTPLFAVHLLLVQILLMVFPFSKLMHVLGMFAERWIINRKYTEPAPGLPNIDIPAARAAGLGLPSEGGVE